MFEVKAQIIRAAMLNAGIKDVRPYLNGIYIALSDESVDVVGTDGHTLYAAHIQDVHDGSEPSLAEAGEVTWAIQQDLQNLGVGGVILPRFVVPPKATRVQFMPPSTKDGVWSVRFITTEGESIIGVRAVDGQYPNYNMAIPSSRGLVGGLFQLDASLFSRAEKSFPSKYNSIRMEFHGADRSCIATSAAHPGCMMLLMPQRLSDDDRGLVAADVKRLAALQLLGRPMAKAA